MITTLPRAATAPPNLSPTWSDEARLVMAIGHAAEILRSIGIPSTVDASQAVRVIATVVIGLAPETFSREDLLMHLEHGTIES